MLGGEIVALRLQTWPPEETVRYLQREIARDDISDSEALRLAEALGFLPLALAHAAAYLKGTVNVSAARYLERINDYLDRTPRSADYDRAVYATFREAIARAEDEAPGAAALLGLASCFAPDALPEELFRQPLDSYEALVPSIPQARKTGVGSAGRDARRDRIRRRPRRAAPVLAADVFARNAHLHAASARSVGNARTARRRRRRVDAKRDRSGAGSVSGR